MPFFIVNKKGNVLSVPFLCVLDLVIIFYITTILRVLSVVHLQIAPFGNPVGPVGILMIERLFTKVVQALFAVMLEPTIIAQEHVFVVLLYPPNTEEKHPDAMLLRPPAIVEHSPDAQLLNPPRIAL